MKIGDRVELHPSTDLWMQGCRFGEIVRIIPRRRKVGPPMIKVKLDRNGREVQIAQHFLTVVS